MVNFFFAWVGWACAVFLLELRRVGALGDVGRGEILLGFGLTALVRGTRAHAFVPRGCPSLSIQF